LIALLDGLHLSSLLTATIGLLSNVQRQLAVASADAEGVEKELDYSNIWTPKKFQDAEYWFLKTGNFDILCSIGLVPFVVWRYVFYGNLY
jgi:hypothetical protein